MKRHVWHTCCVLLIFFPISWDSATKFSTLHNANCSTPEGEHIDFIKSSLPSILLLYKILPNGPKGWIVNTKIKVTALWLSQVHINSATESRPNFTFKISTNLLLLQCYVVGQWGEGSKDLHHFIRVCAEAGVVHLTGASGRHESEHLLGLIVAQYRRLLSITAVRSQAMFLITRVGLTTPAAREAAARRAVTMRMEEMRRDRRAQLMG